MHLQENTLLTLDFWANVTGNVAQYPLHHVPYAPAMFEVVLYMPQFRRRRLTDAFTRKYIIDP